MQMAGTRDADRDSPFSFGYGEFIRWYDHFSVARLEPARQTFFRILNEHLSRELSDFDANRIRISASRVKNPLRLWEKMQQERYADRISKLEDIPAVIDDLVGVRIVCNNLVDIEFLRSVLAAMPVSLADAQQSIAVKAGSEKDYIADPKPSGYRAYHVNLVTIVPGATEITRISGEVQVRTLLQDGWGELTHEDTYKPGVNLPPLVVVLAKRLADLLATVDDLAQDLRDELDRLAQAAAVGYAETGAAGGGEPGADTGAADEHPDTARVAPRLVVDEAARIVNGLTRPASLASVATALQAAFGTGLAPGWAGYGNFKTLLKSAAPDIKIVNAGPGYVIPQGATPSPEWPSALCEALPEDFNSPVAS
jgi:ppGpp synthetase/RelA/SpoT-type nucleotidyltranferase